MLDHPGDPLAPVSLHHVHVEVDVGQRGGRLDDPPALVELDDAGLVHLRQVRLLERGVDALALAARDLRHVDVVLPSGDLFGHLADGDRVICLAFQQVYREPPSLVRQHVEQLVIGNLCRRLTASPLDLLYRRHFCQTHMNTPT
jgi:hypothetical protein